MELSDGQLEINKKIIVELLISTNRPGIANVIDYLYTSGYFIVPSSLNGHHNWKGGLAQHSLNVCQIALALDHDSSNASVILCALLHDICKAAQLRYDCKGYLYKRDTYIKGHGKRSIKLLESLGLRLKEDEIWAIRWHMGGHYATNEEIGDLAIAKKSKLWQSIYAADRWDSNGANIINSIITR